VGKGGYYGGSSIIRADRGYISTPSKKGAVKKAPLTPKEKRARKISEMMKSDQVISIEDARSVRLPFSMWRVRCDKNVKIIERNLSTYRREIQKLQANVERDRELLKLHEGYRRAMQIKADVEEQQ
jgi:hypothetical protein